MISSGCQTDWQVHYEALRAHALGRAPTAFVPLGLGILRRAGVAAWISTSIPSGTSDCCGGESEVGRRRDRDAVVGSAIVQVLAGMTAALVEGERV